MRRNDGGVCGSVSGDVSGEADGEMDGDEEAQRNNRTFINIMYVSSCTFLVPSRGREQVCVQDERVPKVCMHALCILYTCSYLCVKKHIFYSCVNFILFSGASPHLFVNFTCTLLEI